MSDTPNKTWLQKLGSDFKSLFNWLGSPKGQATIAAGEGVLETVVPGTAGFINLGNTWLTEILKAESLATAAGAQTGSGTQKSAMVLNAVTPQVLEFAKVNGLPTPTADKIAAANSALVAFANALSA